MYVHPDEKKRNNIDRCEILRFLREIKIDKSLVNYHIYFTRVCNLAIFVTETTFFSHELLRKSSCTWLCEAEQVKRIFETVKSSADDDNYSNTIQVFLF